MSKRLFVVDQKIMLLWKGTSRNGAHGWHPSLDSCPVCSHLSPFLMVTPVVFDSDSINLTFYCFISQFILLKIDTYTIYSKCGWSSSYSCEILPKPLPSKSSLCLSLEGKLWDGGNEEGAGREEGVGAGIVCKKNVVFKKNLKKSN